MIIASRSVHVDKDGVECSDLDPKVATMIVAAGCPIDEATAARYGLIPALLMDGEPDTSMPAPPPAGSGPSAKKPKPAKKES